MNQVMLAVDILLRTLIGKNASLIESLIERAEAHEIELILAHETIYWALCSIRVGDQVKLDRLLELLKCCSIQSLEFGTPTTRPTDQEIANWREAALLED